MDILLIRNFLNLKVLLIENLYKLEGYKNCFFMDKTFIDEKIINLLFHWLVSEKLTICPSAINKSSFRGSFKILEPPLEPLSNLEWKQ